jgi:hypothetical protein
MKTQTAIFGSNLVNRYGMMMPVRVLESALDQVWDKPLPSSIGHDIHRPIGWNSVIALHLQPGLARVFGAVHWAESAKDMNIVRNVLEETISRHIDALDQQKVAELKEKLGGALSENAKQHAQGCAAYLDPGLARRVFPGLFEKCDKDGLIPFRELNCVAPGVFEKDGLLLFAHQFFRRSLSRHNTLNDPFLGRLMRTAEDERLDVRIALDEDLVGHPATLLQNIELQYWWGPHFSDKLDEIKAGVTRHEASESDRFFNAVSAAEFWWYEQDGRKTFECEELRDLDMPSLGKSATEFGCRFVHSMLDQKTHQSFHLDGAVRLYNEDLMLERVDQDIMHFGRRADYTKIWRVDGDLPVDTWKGLINDYYRDNHLVGEYFGGKEDGEEDVRPAAIKIDEGGSIHEFAPCTMARGDGIRLAISYHSHSSNTSARIIVPTERFDNGDGWIDYVETGVVEFIKLMRRRGESVEFSSDVAIMAFEDMVMALPLIEHCDADSLSRARITLEAILEYCIALRNRGHDRMIGFHVSIRFADRDAHFSYAGHVDDMCAWLQSDFSRLPESVDEVGEWAEVASDWLTKNFPLANDVPPLENMIKLTGLLTVDRKFLNPGEFAFQKTDRYPPVISLVKCPSIERAMPLIKEKGLVVTTAFILKASECQGCHESYQECDCIKIVDPGVTQIVTDAEMCGVFWTDRSAWELAAVDSLPVDGAENQTATPPPGVSS